MAALMNSTPTKILRGIYQQTIHRTPSLEMGRLMTHTLSGVSSSSISESQPITQDAVDDFEAWFVSLLVSCWRHVTSFRYLQQFGETVKASKEGNTVAFTKGLKSFARRVSSIFKSVCHSLLLPLDSLSVCLCR
jgi:hypothetical protein